MPSLHLQFTSYNLGVWENKNDLFSEYYTWRETFRWEFPTSVQLKNVRLKHISHLLARNTYESYVVKAKFVNDHDSSVVFSTTSALWAMYGSENRYDYGGYMFTPVVYEQVVAPTGVFAGEYKYMMHDTDTLLGSMQQKAKFIEFDIVIMAILPLGIAAPRAPDNGFFTIEYDN